MKKILLVVSLLGCVNISLFSQDNKFTNTHPQKVESLVIGENFPIYNEKINDVITGAQFTWNSLKGKNGTLVIFTCNSCPYVIKAEKRTQDVLKEAKKLGIKVVLLNSNEAQRDEVDSEDAMKKYGLKSNYENYYIDKNSALANLFGANRTPEVFLFDSKGKLVYKGAMDDNPADPTAATEMFLSNAMNNMVAGKSITPNATKSVGCTIKRVK